MDSSAGRARKMGREDQPASIGILLEKIDAGLARHVRIDAEPRAPFRIAELQRMVHQVGGEERLTAARAKAEHLLPRRVTVRRLDREVALQRVSISDQLRLPALDDRQHAVGEELAGTLKRR